MNLTSEASRLISLGFSPVPIPKGAGWIDHESKRYHYPWRPYQSAPMSLAVARKEFADPWGMAMVCGAVSGNLLVIDIDDTGIVQELLSVAAQIGDVRHKVAVSMTPSSGSHIICRVPPEHMGRNAKWASDENGHVRIETRAEGGLIFCAPTPGYRFVHGEWADVSPLTDAEFVALKGACQSYNLYRRQVSPVDTPRTPAASMREGVRSGDLFNQHTDWPTVLDKVGARVVATTGTGYLVCRPGKKGGVSARTGMGHRGQDYLYNFSTNWPGLEAGNLYSRFAVLVYCVYDGDWTAAAKFAERKFGHMRKTRI